MERKQFGQPIAEFQLVQAMLADSQDRDLRRALDGASTPRAAATTAATSGPKPRARSCSPPRCAAASPTAPCRSMAAPATSATTAIERFYRDVRLFRIYEGTSQIQQLVIARNMIREREVQK